MEINVGLAETFDSKCSFHIKSENKIENLKIKKKENSQPTSSSSQVLTAYSQTFKLGIDLTPSETEKPMVSSS